MTRTETPPEPAWLEHYGQARLHQRGPRETRRAVLLVAVLTAVIGLVALLRSTQARPWRPPSGAVAFKPCHYGAHDQVAAWCARVAVPLDAARPRGPRIGLHVAVIPAAHGPSHGAVFYLEGGPGGAASGAIVPISEILGKISAHRDLVFVDQRGTGASQRLDCPRAGVRALDQAAVAAYVRRCFARLGPVVRRYGSVAAADDLDAVRRALGFRRIDVFGGSYGATLAQVYLQRHARSVRTAVLDSPSLLSVPLYERWPRSAQHALDAALARCAAQPACRRAYPATRAELARLDTDTAAATVEALTRTPEGVGRLPGLLHDAAGGDGSGLAMVFADQVGEQLEPAAHLAMFWEIHCHEPWARFGVAATAAAARGSYLGRLTVERAKGFARACAAVPPLAEVPPSTQHPVHVPVLLLSGADDPLDPPSNVAGWRQVFPDGHLVVVPGVGHGTIPYGCLPLLAARFVARGSVDGLDASCADRVPLPRFEGAG